MEIRKINIKNYRSISEADFEFDSSLNIFVGVNGAGKTTILDLLSIMLSRLIGRIVSSHGTGRFFSEYHINNDSDETSNNIVLNYGNQTIDWRVSKTRKGKKKQTITNLNKIKDIVKIVQNNLEKDKKSSLPIAVFYSTNRAVLDIPLRIKNKHDFQQIAAYENALSNSRNDFRLFFEWFRGREDYENEMLRDNKDYKDTKLNAVKTAIETFTEFSNLRV